MKNLAKLILEESPIDMLIFNNGYYYTIKKHYADLKQSHTFGKFTTLEIADQFLSCMKDMDTPSVRVFGPIEYEIVKVNVN